MALIGTKRLLVAIGRVWLINRRCTLLLRGAVLIFRTAVPLSECSLRRVCYKLLSRSLAARLQTVSFSSVSLRTRVVRLTVLTRVLAEEALLSFGHVRQFSFFPLASLSFILDEFWTNFSVLTSAVRTKSNFFLSPRGPQLFRIICQTQLALPATVFHALPAQAQPLSHAHKHARIA